MNIEELFNDLCKGNEQAHQFCRTFYDYVHQIDDLIDRDHPIDQKQVVLVFLRCLSVFSGNAFFLHHRSVLMPVIHATFISYILSNTLAAREDTRSKVIGEIIKSEYQTVFLMVAFLIGGVDHQIASQEKWRAWHFG